MRRERALAMAKKRKQEFIGARVPKELRDRIIATAASQAVPVSILVRRLLEEGLDHLCQSASRPTKAVSQPEHLFPDVLGWEELRLNRAVSCARCNRRLDVGDQVLVGIGSPENPYVVICSDCKGDI